MPLYTEYYKIIVKDSDKMRRLKIFDAVNKKNLYISIVRYFKYQNEDYLIYYDTNEKESENHRIILYIAKLRDKISVMILDSEWQNVYSYLRMIGYAAKEKKEITIHDLDIKELNGIIVNNYRKLSLSNDNLKYFMNPNFVDSNIKPGLHEVKRVPIENPTMNKVDYRDLYTKKVEENEKLKKRITDLENLTLSYQINLQQIHEFLKTTDK